MSKEPKTVYEHYKKSEFLTSELVTNLFLKLFNVGKELERTLPKVKLDGEETNLLFRTKIFLIVHEFLNREAPLDENGVVDENSLWAFEYKFNEVNADNGKCRKS